MGQPFSETPGTPEDSADSRARLRQEVRAFADAQGRRPRVMIAHPALAPEDAGARRRAGRLADLGFDVDIGAPFRTAAECARQAIESDVHALGLGTIATRDAALPSAIAAELAAQGAGDIVVFVAGASLAADAHDVLARIRRAIAD